MQLWLIMQNRSCLSPSARVSIPYGMNIQILKYPLKIEEAYIEHNYDLIHLLLSNKDVLYIFVRHESAIPPT